MYINIPGWWFGTMEFYDFPYIGNFIIPTDFHSIIFQRGRRKTTNQIHLQDPIISNPQMPWGCEILVEILWMGQRNPAPTGSLKAQLKIMGCLPPINSGFRWLSQPSTVSLDKSIIGL